MVDTHASGACGATRAGSSPVFGTTFTHSAIADISPDSLNENAGFKIENSQLQLGQISQSPAKVPHFRAGFLGVPDVAQTLGVDESTVRRWCESGKLPAIAKPFGRKITYEISPQAVQMLQQAKIQKQAKAAKPKHADKPHFEMLPKWETAMAKGTLSGKVFSRHTIDDYLRYANAMFQRHKCLTVGNVKSELMRIGAHQIAKREHCYKALLCLGRFLHQEGCIEADFLEQVKTLAPKRHLPPKRITVNADQLNALFEACSSLSDRLILALLSSTGLRASELCALKWADVDLVDGVLIVHLGKGNKTRRVGLCSQAMGTLIEYREAVQPTTTTKPLFLSPEGQAMTRHGLYKRLKRIGDKANVPVSPHGLRRAFVTINANKGRPLQMLQKACGHSDIKTTMGYCLTSEQEVIEAMKDWE